MAVQQPKSPYVRAFREARAASALFCALSEPPLDAAVNGIYEA
jgi:hypothetical protein